MYFKLPLLQRFKVEKHLLYHIYIDILCVQAQKDSLVSSLEYQNHLNEEFANQETSPLTEDDLESFQSLSFFDIDENYIVKAEIHQNRIGFPFRDAYHNRA